MHPKVIEAACEARRPFTNALVSILRAIQPSILVAEDGEITFQYPVNVQNAMAAINEAADLQVAHVIREAMKLYPE